MPHDERAKYPWAQHGKLQNWALIRRSDPQKEVYAACGTFCISALVRRSAAAEVEDTFAYSICSVVTPTKHQRKGHATHLLRLLHYVFGEPSQLPPFPSAWGQPPALSPEMRKVVPYAIASLLWSDVGSTFYEKVSIGQDLPGWKVVPDSNHELTWKLLPASSGPTDLSFGSVLPDGWSWIYESDYPSVAQELKQAILRRFKADKSDDILWALDPTSPGNLQYVHTRGRTWPVPQPDWRTDAASEPCGVRAPGLGHAGGDAICLFTRWMPAISEDRLLVFCSEGLGPKSVGPVLKVLDGLCAGPASETLKGGMIWGLDEVAVQAFRETQERDVKYEQRGEVEGHLFGAAMYTPGAQGRLLDSEAHMWAWC